MEDAKPEENVQDAKYPVTANSALSEYLAVNMMNGNTRIDLKDFPESADRRPIFWMHGRKLFTRIRL